MAKWTAFPHAGDYQFDAAMSRNTGHACIRATLNPYPGTCRYWKPGSSFITANFKKRSRLA
jgi:hypothetical protein